MINPTPTIARVLGVAATQPKCGSELLREAGVKAIGPEAGRMQLERAVGGSAAIDLAGRAGYL